MRKGPSIISCLMLLQLLLLTSACLAASPSIRTEMSNGGSDTMMAHSASTDQSLVSSAEYMVSSTSCNRGDIQSYGSSKSVMQIDESIVSGRATFSVISGGEGSSMAGGGRAGSAWKSPKIEIEEEYIGTYHISKSFAINESHVLRRDFDGWLNFWMPLNASRPAISGLLNLTGNASRSLPDAEEVFGGRR